MNHGERIVYTELALQLELERLGKTMFFTEAVWEKQFIARADVDPLNTHKPYGLVSPQLVNGKIIMGFSAGHMVRPVVDHDDRDMSRWVEYWIIHTALHLIVLDREGSDLSLETIECQVDSELETQGHDLWTFGKQIKLLFTTAIVVLFLLLT